MPYLQHPTSHWKPNSHAHMLTATGGNHALSSLCSAVCHSVNAMLCSMPA